MKRLFVGVALFMSGLLLNLSSCKKNVINQPSTVLSSVQNDGSLNIFAAIVNRAGDDGIINNCSAIVIPVDSAFNSAGITLSSVADLSTTVCDSIVKYYSAPAAVNLNGVANTQMAVTSNLGIPLYADSTSTGAYFNGVAALSQTPLAVANTLIYKLGQYINLPSSSLTQIAANDPNLSLFYEALTRTNFVSTISAGTYTLFMPTNSAFANAGYPDISSIDAANINTLSQILMYQTVTNYLFENDLAQKTTLTTLQGGNILLNNNAGNLLLTGNSDSGSPASLLTNGTLAANLITYKINNVLLP